ncbi:MAG: hypothetical protein IBX64_09010 [Actinobacteria bacterium]|nr:hypothetical protein [Actinomycetota bacterium]
MITSKLKKVTAWLAAVTSILVIAGLIAKIRSKDAHYCACDVDQCKDNKDKDSEFDIYIPEPSVKRFSRVEEVGMQKSKATDAIEIVRAADVLKDLFEKIKDNSLSNEDIAKITISLINLQNAVTPEKAIDIRSIHFTRLGNQDIMEIDLYTGDYGKPAYEDELNRLWDKVFLAENFWNADFAKVRINARDKNSNKSLEIISCNFEDVSRHLLEEILLDEFRACWSRRRVKDEKIWRPIGLRG